MVLAPVEIGEPEIDVRERAADRDMTDAEWRRGDAGGFLLQRIERGVAFFAGRS